MKTIGMIGTGIMGGGMARRLLSKGFPVVVYNRTAEKTKPLQELGAISEAAHLPMLRRNATW